MGQPTDPNPALQRPPRPPLQARIATLAQLGGFEWRPDHAQIEWNEECRRLHLSTAAAPPTLADLLAFYDRDGAQRVHEAMQRLRDGDSAFERVDVRLARAVGNKPQTLRLSLHRDPEQGELHAVTGVFQELRTDTVPGRSDTLAHTDMLTGLANRRGLMAHGGVAVEHARQSGRPLAVLFLDLDHFKAVNDSLGHHAGDELLREVARRLDASVRGSDVVARQSGDEFIIVLSEVNRPQDAALVAQKILDSLLRPIAVLEQNVQIGCSIGVALLAEGLSDLPALMRAADTAMYAAKQSGRNAFRFYSDALDQRQQRRNEREQELRRALARDELFLVYQPTVKLDEGRIGSIEVLLRWRGPDGEMRQPAEFLPLAEDTGEIVPIGYWGLREACRQAHRWSNAGLLFERIAINLSAQQLRDPQFVEQVTAILTECEWPAPRLEFEVTESTLMQDRDATRRVLGALRSQGVSVSVDDFGTGFSNLLYLHRVQVNCLKLDRHFALGMEDDPGLCDLARAMIEMGHALQLRMVAKGVESAFSAQFLAEHRCDEGQGFHFARPMPAADIMLWWQARELSQLARRATTGLNPG
jgi:diguanylate cyclase (GGDEF)-like protein